MFVFHINTKLRMEDVKMIISKLSSFLSTVTRQVTGAEKPAITSALKKEPVNDEFIKNEKRSAKISIISKIKNFFQNFFGGIF